MGHRDDVGRRRRRGRSRSWISRTTRSVSTVSRVCRAEPGDADRQRAARPPASAVRSAHAGGFVQLGVVIGAAGRGQDLGQRRSVLARCAGGSRAPRSGSRTSGRRSAGQPARHRRDGCPAPAAGSPGPARRSASSSDRRWRRCRAARRAGPRRVARVRRSRSAMNPSFWRYGSIGARRFNSSAVSRAARRRRERKRRGQGSRVTSARVDATLRSWASRSTRRR